MGVLIALAVGRGSQRDVYFHGETMGTYYTVEVLGVSAQASRRLEKEIEEFFVDFGSQVSNWRDDSWITSLNESVSSDWAPVPKYAARALALALKLAEQSGGAMDPTMAPMIELWGFGVSPMSEPPSASEVDRVLERVGYQWIEFDQDSLRVRKRRSDVSLNLSAVAKGLAVDIVAERLKSHGFNDFLVNIGGDLRASGVNDQGVPWTVSLQAANSRRNLEDPARIRSVVDQAVATSGHDQRNFEYGGIRYSHILDGRTGWPVISSPRSATAIAPSCVLADGLATLALIIDETEMERLLLEYKDASVEYFDSRSSAHTPSVD